ncbi:MAG TPA: S9 family peptidase [Spongiibacteraceae bacterium]|jgi:dipeptidyl aminopeptidase/acylaminoacyl peptidase
MSKFFSVVLLGLALIQSAIAAPPLEAYGGLPAVELMRLSPSGKSYAFIALVGDQRKLGVIGDGGKVIYARNLGDVKARDIEWVGEDRLLLKMSATFDHPLDLKQAHELFSILNIDLNTSKASSIFENNKKIANVVFGEAATMQIDEHPFMYFIGLAYGWSKGASENRGYFFDGDHRNLYRVNLDTNEIDMQVRGGEGPKYDWLIGNDGKVIVRSEYDVLSGIWRLYAGETRAKLLLERSSKFRDIDLVGLGRTPNTVWIADSTSGTTITEEIAVADGASEKIFDGISALSYLTDPDSRLAIGITTRREPNAKFFDPKLQARLKGTRKAFSGLQMELVSFSRNLDRLIVKTDGGDDSGTYWLVDIGSGAANPIGKAYPEIRKADVGPTQWVSYKAADGLDIQAVLTLPPGHKAESLPLIVLPHGGPIGVEDVVGFDWWAQAFASVGYAVLQPNYRGSAGDSQDFLLAGYGQWGRKMQTDLSDGVTALASQGIINPKRVCIVGASYGGYAALAGVTLQHDIYRCAVSVAGPADLSTFFRWQIERHGLESDATRYWRAVTGADKEGNSAMRAISPVQFAEQASSPILLIHGKDDTIVPLAQSEQMESALRSAHKSVELITMDGEDHWLSRDETRKTMLKASVAFVKEYNPPN